jgi:hypothetical protein
MTNPVAFIVQDATTGYSALTSPASNGKVALPVYLNSDLSLGYDVITSDSTYWTDPACTNRIEFSSWGKLDPNPNIQSPAGNSYPLSGGIEISFQVITQLKGNCTPTLQFMMNCYNDLTQCGGSSNTDNLQIQQEIFGIFDPMIQAQVIRVSDIPNLINYAYIVSYE